MLFSSSSLHFIIATAAAKEAVAARRNSNDLRKCSELDCTERTQREFNGMKASTGVCITEAKHAAIINSVTLLQPFAMVHNQELQAADDYRQFRIFLSLLCHDITWVCCINFFPLILFFRTKSKKWCQIIFMNLIHPNDLLTFDSANCPDICIRIVQLLKINLRIHTKSVQHEASKWEKCAALLHLFYQCRGNIFSR